MQRLLMRTIRVTDLIVEQARQDKADARAARAADVSEDSSEVGNGHGDDVAEDNDDGRDDCEADFGDAVAG